MKKGDITKRLNEAISRNPELGEPDPALMAIQAASLDHEDGFKTWMDMGAPKHPYSEEEVEQDIREALAEVRARRRREAEEALKAGNSKQ